MLQNSLRAPAEVGLHLEWHPSFVSCPFLLPYSLMGFSWKHFLHKSLANQCLSWDLLLGNSIQVSVCSRVKTMEMVIQSRQWELHGLDRSSVGH